MAEPFQTAQYKTCKSLRAWSLALALTTLLGSMAFAGHAADCMREIDASDDYRAETLARCIDAIRAQYANDDREIPLDEKASFYAWQIRRYHRNSQHQVTPHVTLPTEIGDAPRHEYNADMSTWNGALLAALSYRYAATREREVLRWIEELVAGLHFFRVVTGREGLVARCVFEGATPVQDANLPYTDGENRHYQYRSDPAKGTYNQIFSGYAALLSYVYVDLQPETQQLVRQDIHALAWNLVKNEYRILGEKGTPTTYGDLRPTFLFAGIPFNAQVTYLIVATGHDLPAADLPTREDLAASYTKLRLSHVYYRNPWLHLFLRPQRLGRSPFLDANDRNHLVTAAFMGLELELAKARAENRKPDPRFLQQLAQTIFHSTPALRKQHNALANFMWLALLSDEQRFSVLIPKRPERARRQAQQLLADGVEQLRRFPLDRFRWTGTTHQGKAASWMDEYRPDSYAWKIEPRLYFEKTGPRTNRLVAAIDYLHAYWIYRYFELDRSGATLHEYE